MNQEMRGMRQAAIVKAREEEREEAARAAADGHPAPAPAPTVNEIVIPPEQPTPEVTRAAAAALQAYRDADQARRAPGDEKRVQRAAAIAAAAAKPPTVGAATQSPSATAAAPSPSADAPAQTPSTEAQLTATQRQALAAFVDAADGIAAALSGDNLTGFNQGAAKLTAVLAALQKEFGPAHPWSAVVQPVAKACQLQSSTDLTDARKQFLLFSTATVEFTTVLRETDPAFSGLKTYHCPMAPEPGLWMQAKGPLRNPFYGSKMLTCGEEVKP
jgi:hypothetical protein